MRAKSWRVSFSASRCLSGSPMAARLRARWKMCPIVSAARPASPPRARVTAGWLAWWVKNWVRWPSQDMGIVSFLGCLLAQLCPQATGDHIQQRQHGVVDFGVDIGVDADRLHRLAVAEGPAAQLQALGVAHLFDPLADAAAALGIGFRGFVHFITPVFVFGHGNAAQALSSCRPFR